MPLVDIHLIEDGAPLPADLAQRLADALGAVWQAEPGRVWVTLHPMPRHLYAENGAVLDGPPPVFLRVLQARLAPADALAAQAAALAATVAAATGRPAERVHVVFEPAGAGRVAFGGQLVGP